MTCVHRAAIGGLVAIGLLGNVARAQPVLEVVERDLPAWMTRWSPLTEIGSITRGLPTAGHVTPSFVLPAPAVGLLWTGGNPAGLAWELGERRSEFVTGAASEAGPFKLPLAPEATDELRGVGRGWQPLGEHGAGIGSAAVARSELAPSSGANLFAPYASPRLVPTDTSTSALRRTQARLDAGAGWRLGGWGVGIALGYDTRTSETDAAAFVRRTRVVLPAASLGVARRLSDGFLVGAHSTWQGGEELVDLNVATQQGVLHQLEGYREVPPNLITSTSPYFRRASRAALRHALSASGRVGEWRWAAVGAVEDRSDRFAGVRANDPLTDDWLAEGRELGVAVQRPLFGGRALLTAEGRWRAVRGRSDLVAPGGDGIATDEERTDGRLDVRLREPINGWLAVLRIGASYEERELTDSVAALRSDLRGATPSLSVELSRMLRPNLRLVGGVAVARYAGTGTVPEAAAYGPVFQRMFAPELDLMTSEISVTAFQAALAWTSAAGTEVWLAARREGSSSETPDRAFLPGGKRQASALTLTVVLP